MHRNWDTYQGEEGFVVGAEPAPDEGVGDDHDGRGHRRRDGDVRLELLLALCQPRIRTEGSKFFFNELPPNGISRRKWRSAYLFNGT